MIMKRAFLLVALIVAPNIVFGDEYDINNLKQTILSAGTADAATKALNDAAKEVHNGNNTQNAELKTSLEAKINNAIKAYAEVKPYDTRNQEQKDSDLAEKQKAYEDAKANEQSMANKTLTALTTAATGIGGMELAMGLSEQKADKDAANSMAAYIATMRCTYADGKQVKAGPDEIELPGGNNQQLTNLRAEYFALAADLKERKTALGMQPGIESEEILDKAATGLYDDETKGIDSGAYASLYRAQMLGSDADQAKIDAEQKASKNRVIAGAVVGGVGVVGGIVGNSLINGKLGELIKKDKNCKSIEKLYKTTTDSLEKLKSCLETAGATDTDKLAFDYFQADWLSLSDIKCEDLLSQNTQNNKTAKGLFLDSNTVEDVNAIVEKLTQSFGKENVKNMLGAENTDDAVLQTALKAKISKRASEYQDAIEQDEKSGCNSSFLDGIKTGIVDAKKAD